MRGEAGDELVAVACGGGGVGGDLGDEGVDAGEIAALSGGGGVGEAGDGSAGGVDEGFELDDFSVEYLEGVGGVEVVEGGLFDTVRRGFRWFRIGTPRSVGGYSHRRALFCARRWRGLFPRKHANREDGRSRSQCETQYTPYSQ